MKKIFYLIFFAFLYNLGLQAQCTPDVSITKNGIYPRNLPDAKEDSTYDQIIQFKLPADTQSFLGLVKFDSISITEITNIPKGLIYNCSPMNGYSSCTWPGGGNGCIRLFGSPDSGSYGMYRCVAKLKAYVVLNGNTTFFSTTDTILFRVRSAYINEGISFLETSQIISIYPNPADQYLNINTELPLGRTTNYTIFDISGRKIKEIFHSGLAPELTIGTSELNHGIYFLRISNSLGEQTFKFVK